MHQVQPCPEHDVVWTVPCLQAPKAAARKVLTSHAARTCQAVAFDWTELAGLLQAAQLPTLETVAEHVQVRSHQAPAHRASQAWCTERMFVQACSGVHAKEPEVEGVAAQSV